LRFRGKIIADVSPSKLTCSIRCSLSRKSERRLNDPRDLAHPEGKARASRNADKGDTRECCVLLAGCAINASRDDSNVSAPYAGWKKLSDSGSSA
jgi:hypothetical protein